MLDDLNELKTLEKIVACGSLSAAARELNVSLAVVSKRLATLERRAGVRLVNRTTRSLLPTEEGQRLLTEVERALEAIRQGEEQLVNGRDEPIGVLRVSAPVSFGRRHVAPVLGALVERHPRLSVALSLDDRLVDVVGGEVDVAIRIGGVEGGAAMRRLADNIRIAVAAPAYLDRRGRPQRPADLQAHAILRYGETATPWRLLGPDGAWETVAASARLRADNADAVHDWCVAGRGVMLKSLVDVRHDLAAGRLERVLPGWSAGAMPIVALFPDRATVPRKTRAFLDALAEALRGEGDHPPDPPDKSAGR